MEPGEKCDGEFLGVLRGRRNICGAKMGRYGSDVSINCLESMADFTCMIDIFVDQGSDALREIKMEGVRKDMKTFVESHHGQKQHG